MFRNTRESSGIGSIGWIECTSGQWGPNGESMGVPKSIRIANDTLWVAITTPSRGVLRAFIIYYYILLEGLEGSLYTP